MSDLSDRRPLYRRLRDQIATEIARGDWRPGERIPTEAELMSKYQFSSGTVSKALDLLEDDGLIDRIQGSGTFVRRPNFSTINVKALRCFGSAADRRTPRARILERQVIVPPLEVRIALQLATDAKVICLKRVRIHDGLPVLREVIWLDLARFTPILDLKDGEQQLLYPLYESLCGEVVARIEESVTIEMAEQADAELLGMSPDRPIVLTTRRALGYDNRPIELRLSRGPASDLHYQLEIR